MTATQVTHRLDGGVMPADPASSPAHRALQRYHEAALVADELHKQDADDAVVQDALDRQCKALERVAAHRELRYLAISLAIGVDPDGQPHYSEADVEAWFARADAMGAPRPRVAEGTVVALWRGELVPNAQLRDLFERSEANATTIAAAMGFIRSRRDPTPDATTVLRMLGIRTSKTGVSTTRGAATALRLWLRREQAIGLARALGLAPHTIIGL